MDDVVDVYIVRHTAKATFVSVRANAELIWIPKSVITQSCEKPLEPGDEYKFPEGRPAVLRLARWFITKNYEKLRRHNEIR